MFRPRRILTLAMLTTAMLTALGGPAGAAPGGTVEAHIFLRDFTLAADGPALQEDLDAFLSSDKPGWAKQMTLSVDTSAASTVADVAVEAAYPGVTCSARGSVTQCTVPGPHQVIVVPANGSFSIITSPSVKLTITPKPAVAAGDTGVLTVTARADEGPVSTDSSTIRIGEGANLTAVDTKNQSVKPAGSVALRPRVRNTGGRDVHGLTLVVSSDHTLSDTNYGNCAYDYVIACTFGTTVSAGRTYQISAPFAVEIPRDAAVASTAGVNVEWLTNADWQDMQAGGPGGRQGTGADLELNELTSAAAQPLPQTDIDGDDNGDYITVTVAGNRRLDVVAVGAMMTGSPAAAHTIEVGLINRGPGTLYYPPFFNTLPFVYVTLPPGLSDVKADKRCSPLFEDDPAGPPPSAAARGSVASLPPEYICRTERVRIRPGQRLMFTFTAKATRAGKGSVEVFMDESKSIDRNTANNNALITVTARDNGKGGGGGLPITGSTTATVAGLGLLLLLTGAAIRMGLGRRTESSEHDH